MAITALPMDVWLKERLKKWVQLSGHEGSIVPASTCTLYKKQAGNCSEARAYEAISRDPYLTGFTPRYFKQLQKNDECFIEIEDLLQQFADPTKTSIMDIKMGTRTFLESEVSNTKRRKDLYEKMTAIDPDEPTPEERACGEITKLRYMQFRERESSSAELGFRIEAAKMPGGSLQKNFKKVRTYDDVTLALIEFFGADRERVRSRLLARLKAMRRAIENSRFFATHEVSIPNYYYFYNKCF
ncbi:inositol-pentakisphosphate 2-kinase [Ancylostoma duodenale]|uniref:Kinase n=1 Tax=Ancylostoma duodenale TaxID=51022 RepID=A0A0C2GXX7_9BILA|nr:inositol-pentakisphosphate 2-kinase [Ancylostoma duodenale]